MTSSLFLYKNDDIGQNISKKKNAWTIITSKASQIEYSNTNLAPIANPIRKNEKKAQITPLNILKPTPIWLWFRDLARSR